MTESLQEIERLVLEFALACRAREGHVEARDALLSAITRVVQERAKHRIECNYPNGPIGAGGCICEVVNKNESARRDARIAELEKALREYGKHKLGCYDKRQVVPRCVCGLNTALASRDAP